MGAVARRDPGPVRRWRGVVQTPRFVMWAHTGIAILVGTPHGETPCDVGALFNLNGTSAFVKGCAGSITRVRGVNQVRGLCILASTRATSARSSSRRGTKSAVRGDEVAVRESSRTGSNISRWDGSLPDAATAVRSRCNAIHLAAPCRSRQQDDGQRAPPAPTGSAAPGEMCMVPPLAAV